MASSHSFWPGALSRMEDTSFLIESETDLLWLASDCHVGGSLGFRASDLAARIIEHEPSMIDLPVKDIVFFVSEGGTN